MTTIVATPTAVYSDSCATGLTAQFSTMKTFYIKHEDQEFLAAGCGYLQEITFMAKMIQVYGIEDLWKVNMMENWPPKIMKRAISDMVVVDREKRIWSLDQSMTPCLVNEDVWTDGSGGQWARAALDHGKTPVEAIEYAATRDPYTKAPVQVLKFPRRPKAV